MSGPLFFDRVQETATVTGTSNPFTLTGAVPGFQQFSAVLSDGDTVYYAAAAVDGSGVPTGSWEEGVGTFSASGGTIARTTVMFSSNGNAAVNWVSGTKRIAIVAPAAMVAGCVLLAKLSASNSASLDFISRNANGLTGAIFQADFDEYQIEFVNIVPVTAGADLDLRFSTDGGSTFDSGANYDWVANQVTNTPFNGVLGSNSQTAIVITQTISTGTGNSLNGTSTLYGAGSSVYKMIRGHTAVKKNDGNWYTHTFSGQYKSATAVNAMRFLMSSGNISSGTIRVYGLRK